MSRVRRAGSKISATLNVRAVLKTCYCIMNTLTSTFSCVSVAHGSPHGRVGRHKAPRMCYTPPPVCVRGRSAGVTSGVTRKCKRQLRARYTDVFLNLTRTNAHSQHRGVTTCVSSASGIEALGGSKAELNKVIEVAIAAAKNGGEVIRKKVGADVIKTKGNPQDLLTEVDGEVQEILESAVKQAFPAHGFLVSAHVPLVLLLSVLLQLESQAMT
eukprot:1194643-Prorocentrum_minimum.AAC.4